MNKAVERCVPMAMDERRVLARRIFEAAVDAVRPERLVSDAVSLQGDTLRIMDARYPLRHGQKVYLFGSGKASAGMARRLLAILKERVAGGVIVTPPGMADDLAPLVVVEGAHPVPDQRSVNAAQQLLEGLSRLNRDDLFIYLLSGGASALIEKPHEPITLEEMQEVTRLLLHSNTPIHQVNAVRKHLSRVKGGRLGQCTPATGAVLVISDVIHDDLAVIGSGPLYCDPSRFAQCRQILERAAIWDAVSQNVRSVIEKGEQGEIEETPKEQQKTLRHYLLGSNRVALAKACQVAEQAGLRSHILTASLAGEAREVAKVLVALAENVSQHGEPFAPPVCLVCGGETTVTVRGAGKGGRNQELALAALREIGERDTLLLLSAGTDGIDGNTSAAGAMADSGYFKAGARLGLSIDDFLKDNDAHHYFQAVGGLLETGPTGTNVMDIVILLIDREDL